MQLCSHINQYYAKLWDRSKGVGSVEVGCGPCTPLHDVPPHARTAGPRPLSAPALVDALLTPNCVSPARRRGVLRLEFDRTAMQAYFCMGFVPWTLSDGHENHPEMEESPSGLYVAARVVGHL